MPLADQGLVLPLARLAPIRHGRGRLHSRTQRGICKSGRRGGPVRMDTPILQAAGSGRGRWRRAPLMRAFAVPDASGGLQHGRK